MRSQAVLMRPGLAGDRSSGEVRVSRPRQRRSEPEATWPTLEIVRKVNCEASDSALWQEFLGKFGHENRAKGQVAELGSMALVVMSHTEFDEMFSAKYDRKLAVCRARRLQKVRQIANRFNVFAREEEQTVIRNSLLDISVLACGTRDLPADASDLEMAAQMAAWTAQDEAVQAGRPTVHGVDGSLLWTYGSCLVQRFEPLDNHSLSLDLIGNDDLFREHQAIGSHFRDKGFNTSKLEPSYHPGVSFFRTFGVAGRQMFRMTDYDFPKSIPLTPPQAVVIA